MCPELLRIPFLDVPLKPYGPIMVSIIMVVLGGALMMIFQAVRIRAAEA